MTDTPSPATEPEDADLLASLYLDGEATEEERARVEASPELMAQVRRFAALAQQLPAITPPEALRDSQIANALAVFDQQVSSAPVASVASLDAKRLKRRNGGGLPTWLGAAAALALVVGGLGFVASGGLGGSDDEAATADMGTDATESVSPSAASRLTSTTAAEESMADDAMADEAMEEEASTEMAEAEMADDAMASGDAADSDEAAEEAEDVAADEAGLAPIELDQFDATTAADFYELVADTPPLPVDASPCADSPLVRGLFGVDSYLPVVFEGERASLLFRDGDPSTAVIVGLTCEITLE